MSAASRGPATAGLLAAACGMAACAQAVAPGSLPARWALPVDAACVAQAEAFASQAAGQAVTLGPAAFAHSSRLVLEHAARRDAQGRLLEGRMRPHTIPVFDLLLRDGVCVMRHEPSGREAVLTACRAEPVPMPMPR